MPRSLHLIPLAVLIACGDKAPEDSGAPPVTTTPPDTDTSDTDTYVPPTDTGPTTTAVELCPALDAATGTVVNPGEDIQAAVDAAAAGEVIVLADGTWDLAAPVVIRTDGVTLRGESGDPSAVVLDGGYAVDSVIRVAASDVTVAGLTVTGGTHGILVQPETADISGVTIDTVVAVDHGREHILVDADPTDAWFADDGEVRCSRVELTDAGRSQVVGLCETGGIHLRRASGWAVRDNEVEGFWCDQGASGHGIRLSEGTRDGLVERNMLVDVANGIGLGWGDLPGVRLYDDQPCGGATAQDFGGTVRNNMIYAWDDGLMASDSGVGVGISLQSACEATAVHNTVYSLELPEASISQRYPLTTGIVANNLLNSTLRRLDSADADVSTNIENADDLSFVHPPSGDLHLSPAATDLMDAADPTYAVTDDIDGEERDPSMADIGADEWY